ncbi:MAG: hypothetical protein AB7V13_00145 [Pseudorhodoplanes sp.]
MLQLRHLKLRALTAQSEFGCDLSFDKPVNVVRAGNTSGKSTCLQAVNYALGLERAFGPRTGIPMTFAMQERIQRLKDGPYERVLQSYVELEVENVTGALLTVRRDITGGTETKLIQTWPTGRLTGVGPPADQRDFFVHDAGAAQHEDGFHTYLANFIGFDLPRVTRYDGGESPLYLEALFPMFFVEQKRGWSALQGPFPTHLQIQDVPRRVMEFILDLDIGKTRRELAEVRIQLRDSLSSWTVRRDDLLATTRNGCRISGVPVKPTPEFVHDPRAPIDYFLDGQWVSIEAALQALTERQLALREAPPPSSQTAASAIEVELAELRHSLDELSVRQEDIRDRERAQKQQMSAIETRLSDLKTDLERNKDALKLKELGSILGHAASDHQCPTCHQSVDAELMPLASGTGMAIDKNVEFIRSQIVMYEASAGSIARQLAELQLLAAALQQQSVEMRARVRALRQALMQPADSPSIAALEAALVAQSKIADLNASQERVDEVISELIDIAREYVRLDALSRDLARAGISPTDRSKIDYLVKTIREQLVLYGYKSFLPTEITLAEDNLRPIAEVRDEGEIVQREIGLNDSASDGTRLKWAYYLSMLALARHAPINHFQLNIFDEPGQQEVEWESMVQFLKWIAENVKDRQQVIVTTSETKQRIESALAGFDANIINFEGFILQPK